MISGPIHLAKFLDALRRAIEADDGLDVVLGETTRGVVYVHPDDEAGEIDVRLRA